MNVYQHSLLSQRKFGGQPQDYEAIHAFMDSSKLFYYHVRHRMLIHNLYGIELAAELFGDYLTNSDGKQCMVRDIAAAHCREDLDGQVPTLHDWLKNSPKLDELIGDIPPLGNEKLEAFVWRPFLRSGIKGSLIITWSDFGVYLAERFLGLEAARTLAQHLPDHAHVKMYLNHFQFTERWQYSPQRHELHWLQEKEAELAAAVKNELQG